ncbi:uncharacterized protein LOC113516500 [Galleria mellonella]|uniref:Uncharacterized protein LOC113516500 n=1 Tax=Galleria mellonella TaxID=7137 RepID=A0ABM3MYB0_GALME|nr:uncharacterized protein LOC113516500 [Galleria mellonella]XP_052756341.1 uncharacterized protein LOC113516500 [Galleria mellonella]
MFTMKTFSVSSLLLVFIMVLNQSTTALFLRPLSTELNGVKKATRWNLPWLGVGMWCNGCPPRSCEDDEAIIHGYCCGCAYTLDKLPVMCPEFLQCPLNLHGLCHDYEYMMRCCC